MIKLVFILPVLLPLGCLSANTTVSHPDPGTKEQSLFIEGLTVRCVGPLSGKAKDPKTHSNTEKRRTPVYLIGGGPAFSSWHLEPLQRALAIDRKVCRWDMRGVGENRNAHKYKHESRYENSNKLVESKTGTNADVPRPSRLSEWLNDMHHIMTYLSGREPAILWGHSWGALQIQLFARQFPDLPLKLILSNPVDPGLSSMQNLQNKLYRHEALDSRLTLDVIDSEDELDTLFRLKIASYFKDAEKGWDYARQFSRQDGNGALNVAIWEEYRKTGYSVRDLFSLEHKITGAIHCREDVLQPESLTFYQRAIPAKRQVILSNCGHFPWVENPTEYIHSLKNRLRSVDRSFHLSTP